MIIDNYAITDTYGITQGRSQDSLHGGRGGKRPSTFSRAKKVLRCVEKNSFICIYIARSGDIEAGGNRNFTSYLQITDS